MSGKNQGWFSGQWINYWDAMNQDHSRKKGGSVQSMGIEEGEIWATALCGLDSGKVRITAKPLSEQEIENILHDLNENRSILFQIYQGTVDAEMLYSYNHQFGLKIPPLQMACTCQDPVHPCRHLQTIALAVAEVFSKDLTQFLRFRGIEEGQIFHQISKQEEPDNGGPATTADFGLIPLPARTTEVEKWRENGPPPFWTSSFSFPQMMREIYGKVREEARKK